MELLTITHRDFTMYIECGKFSGIWEKAKGNVGEANLLSTYTWTDGVESVVRGDETLVCGEKAQAVFFDNAEYPIWVEFNKHVDDAQFGSMLQSDNERFTFRKDVLAGFINYGNDIGRSELNIIYRIGKDTRRFTFGYEVLSTKLNYHEHWKKIVEDIESEYRMLALDYMKRTFHGFSPDVKGDTPRTDMVEHICGRAGEIHPCLPQHNRASAPQTARICGISACRQIETCSGGHGKRTGRAPV